ncbi:dicer-like protein-like protein 2 [Lophiotrema nucula]|uniref:Dicer-like protein-like protein 2 n=1 Tax=Lophiotrema nucula TaxID=690887 RepID=A0A6A5ZCK1_9PLEO|nr:dicer-like protein-like protein 2 [Lophiotrema nucula]
MIDDVLSKSKLTDEPADGGASVIAGFDNEAFRLRSYQAEMVEESLRSNIIVAMDTGSGKTHIALARTAAELERCHPEQCVWFLAPTVTLIEQQEEVFKKNLPAYGIKALTGKDDVDHWTEQSVWDAVLKNVRIVLSTHQVLLDTLSHGFVKMQQLALIIFDEAHHCTKNHPANLIMKDFYRPLVQTSDNQELGLASIPWIMGLSASPVMKARVRGSDLETIEYNLHAITKTPKLHRSELIRFVHKPELVKITHPVDASGQNSPPLLAVLSNMLRSYDLASDPYVVDLRRRERRGENVSQQLNEVVLKESTYCLQQLRSIVAKGTQTLQELGVSATDWYLRQCIVKSEVARRSDQVMVDWSIKEKEHLQRLFTTHKVFKVAAESADPAWTSISEKVQIFIDVLLSEALDYTDSTSQKVRPEFTCLVFVEQRVWVAVLAEILSRHPRTQGVFNVGTFVGTSESSKRKVNIANLAEPRNQTATLDDFREGRTNLFLATSVLEEGIDVSSCHLVICFERPKNLKSFIQRRGRARRRESKYIIFLPDSDDTARSPEKWQQLEHEMVEAYLNDLREVKQAEERELTEEDIEMFYKVEATGALLTLENALPHLHHFCSIVSSGPFKDSRPQFRFHENSSDMISAEVTLPISVDPAYRTARSDGRYVTERVAKRAAAFQAYRALHQAGLVNDNLLPSHKTDTFDEMEFQIPDHTPSLVEVSPPYDPWVPVARQQQQNPQVYHRILLKLSRAGEDPFCMLLLMPYSMPEVPDITLYWNRSTRYSIQSIPLQVTLLDQQELDMLRSITRRILFSVFYGRMAAERYDFLWLLAPCNPRDMTVNYEWLKGWNTDTETHRSACDLISSDQSVLAEWGMVNVLGDGCKYLAKAVGQGIVESSLSGKRGPQIQVLRIPRRRDFLHPENESNSENEAYTRLDWLNAADCVVDTLPSAFSTFALFVPSIIHKYEVYLRTEMLRTTILAPIGFGSEHLGLLLRALTSSSVSGTDNYQRLEFLGDCILKIIASIHLMADNLKWPESYLTGKKGKIVSNGFLARATLAAGLDKFIITTKFTGAKWSPRYAGDVVAEVPRDDKETRSSKLLADVIESLIGASYVVGGFEKAFLCVKTILPLEAWTPVPQANTLLYEAADTDTVAATNLSSLEQLVGYTFNKKVLLLEAITHASYTGPNARSSYERLEFLGDAVLDYIISKRLFAHKPDITHQRMHAIRTSMVNAAFLAFRMFETTIEQTTSINTVTMLPDTRKLALWQFMRHTSPSSVPYLDAAVEQHAAAKTDIIDAVENDERFPWHLLSLTDSPKFLSDIVESVIGAIYIDSRGSIQACESFASRLGILSSLERILNDGVDCLHPKERLGHLADTKRVQYVKLENVAGSKMYRVQIRVGDKEIGGPVEGLKRLQAETIAAWKAVRIMEGKGENVDMDMDHESEMDEWHDAEEGGGIEIEMEG